MRAAVGVVEVAADAGVSIGTVSNVLNRPERVAEGTRTRVLASIEKLGFVRNEVARQLRAGRSRTIGLIVLDVGNPFFTDMAAGVEQAAEEAGLLVVLCNSGESTVREDHYLRVLEEQRVYGMLVTPVGVAGPRIEQIRRRGIPVVLADSGTPRGECSASVDDILGGELAVNHLLSMGHERIAFAGGPTSIKQVADRLAGAQRATRSKATPAGRVQVLFTPGLNVASGRLAAEQILAVTKRRRPTAVFCANDLVALGVLQEMTRQGVAVPKDLAIVGYDDIEFAAGAAVPLSSVRQPRQQLGRAAAELVIEEAENPDTHQHRQVTFQPELIVRESSGG